MTELEREKRKVAALEYEIKRLKQQLASRVTVMQAVKEMHSPGSARFLLGNLNGDLLGLPPFVDKPGSWVRPVKSGGLGELILRQKGPCVVTIFRTMPWRTLEVTEWAAGEESNYWKGICNRKGGDTHESDKESGS